MQWEIVSFASWPEKGNKMFCFLLDWWEKKRRKKKKLTIYFQKQKQLRDKKRKYD